VGLKKFQTISVTRIRLAQNAKQRVTRKKTRQQHSVSLFASALVWEYDPLHCLAAQLVVDSFGTSDTLFGSLGLSESQDGVAAYINRLIQSVCAEDTRDELTKNLKSHSSRRGSAVVASSHSDINLCDLAHRGRWTALIQ